MSTRATRRQRRLRIIVAAAALAAVAASFGVTASNAEPGGDPPQAPEGDRLLQLSQRDEVRDLASSLDLYKEPGYGKVTIDLDKREVHVFWKGTPPNEVLDQLGVHANGIEVSLTPAIYSDVELTAAGEKLFTAGRRKGGLRMQGVGRTPDMSGLVAEVLPADLKAVGAASTSSVGRVAINGELSKIAGVPVETIEGLGVTSVTRQNDSPPWQGGGAMRWPDVPTAYCTTGFAMLTSSGAGRLLSAAHCEPTGNHDIRDGTGNETIAPGGASVDVRHAGIDSMIIDPSASPGTIGKIFGGAFNQAPGTAQYEYHVGGWAAPLEGDDGLCLSGANSGQHCNKIVRETGFQYDCPGNTSLTCSGFRYSGPVDVITVAQGDSGGPIYIERADGRVGARGIQSAAVTASEVDCPAVADNNPPVRCFRTAIGVAITRIQDYWNDNGHPGLHVEFD